MVGPFFFIKSCQFVWLCKESTALRIFYRVMKSNSRIEKFTSNSSGLTTRTLVTSPNFTK